MDLLKDQLAAVQQQLTDLINQRACESTNQGASIHHTINHMHRMMLIPEGQRPGGCMSRQTKTYVCHTQQTLQAAGSALATWLCQLGLHVKKKHAREVGRAPECQTVE